MFDWELNIRELNNYIYLYTCVCVCVCCSKKTYSVLCLFLTVCSQGETVYSYQEAMILRTKLVKLYEAIDQLR